MSSLDDDLGRKKSGSPPFGVTKKKKHLFLERKKSSTINLGSGFSTSGGEYNEINEKRKNKNKKSRNPEQYQLLYSEFMKVVEENEETRGNLKKSVVYGKKILEDKKRLKKKVRKLKVLVSDKEHENMTLKNQVDDLKEEIHGVQVEMKLKETELFDEKSESSSRLRQFEKLQRDYSGIVKKNQKQRLEKKQLQATKDSLMNRISAIEQTGESLKRELHFKNLTIQKMQKIKDECKTLKMQKEELRQQTEKEISKREKNEVDTSKKIQKYLKENIHLEEENEKMKKIFKFYDDNLSKSKSDIFSTSLRVNEGVATDVKLRKLSMEKVKEKLQEIKELKFFITSSMNDLLDYQNTLKSNGKQILEKMGELDEIHSTDKAKLEEVTSERDNFKRLFEDKAIKLQEVEEDLIVEKNPLIVEDGKEKDSFFYRAKEGCSNYASQAVNKCIIS